MPWTVADVDRHKKGLSSSQKSKWVKIANAALQRCQAKGGSACDASAIRIANAAFELEADAIFLFEEAQEFAVSAGSPLANYHSCRMTEPNYDAYAYKKCKGKHDGKCIDHVYGIPEKGASELQAMRYPTSSWTASEARSHCSGKGTFTAAKSKEKQSEGCPECSVNLSELEEWTDEDVKLHDEFFANFDDGEQFQKKDTEKAGGSNAGKYKSGPFCGPSGGAPKGTYPVNTRARAKAALAYARHAPNPSGIKSCVCRHYSDLPSCKSKSKTSMEVNTMTERLKVPEAALHFMDHECFAKAVISGQEGARPQMNMVAYSGKAIKNHWYWGDVVFDLDGMKFDKKTYPILENHRTDRKVGFSKGRPLVENYQLKADPDKVEFVDTEAANEFLKLSGQGFPYESSIYGVPSTVERLEEGAIAEVNGFTMKGPGAIWRQWTFKEMSICVFGHDSNTRSTAFSKEELELDLEERKVSIVVNEGSEQTNEKEVMTKMTLQELKEKNPDVYEAIMNEAKEEIKESVTQEVEAKFAQEKKVLEDKHKEEKEGLTDRILGLEKKDEIRTANEMRARADNIWFSKLDESDIPEHLFAKVSAHVSYTKFVKEGVLDEQAFTEAIDAEIKDWESKGVTSSVLGVGFTRRSETDGDGDDSAEKFDKDSEEALNTLYKLAGVESSAN